MSEKMADREYVNLTVVHLAEHVPWMWHEFAAWMLREVVERHAAIKETARLHDQWENVSRSKWKNHISRLLKMAKSQPWPVQLSMNAAVWSTGIRRRYALNLDFECGYFSHFAASSVMQAVRGSAHDAIDKYRRMARQLRTSTLPMGDPLVSADWWEERGEPKLAEMLRRQTAE